ncbi:MAG: hypothetical protein ABJI59_20265 [Nisaea sp.]|uniref:hypothetical protein n=1 Tax=Nisaea sp. TaxID=2024842 RepID=UPI003298C5E9
MTCGHLVRHFHRFAADLDAHGIAVHIPPVEGQQLDSAEMVKAIVGQRLVIAGDDVIDRPVLEAGKATGLEAIIKWGIGTDGIDKVAAAELSIAVYNTPGVFSEEVADCAAAYVVNLARGLQGRGHLPVPVHRRRRRSGRHRPSDLPPAQGLWYDRARL